MKSGSGIMIRLWLLTAESGHQDKKNWDLWGETLITLMDGGNRKCREKKKCKWATDYAVDQPGSQLSATFESYAQENDQWSDAEKKKKKRKNEHVSLWQSRHSATKKKNRGGSISRWQLAFLPLLLSPPPLSSLQLAPSHPSGMMEWLPCSTPPFPSPVTLHVYPNIHCVCQTGCFPPCPSLPSLSVYWHTHSHTHTRAHTHAHTHTSNVRSSTVIIHQL